MVLDSYVQLVFVYYDMDTNSFNTCHQVRVHVGPLSCHCVCGNASTSCTPFITPGIILQHDIVCFGLV